MNREWHNKPLQGGGRDAWDYGRTNLVDDERLPVSRMEALLTMALIFVVPIVIAALWNHA